MIGLYLDLLATAGEWDALDRVIQAQRWDTGGGVAWKRGSYTPDTLSYCLIEHAGANIPSFYERDHDVGFRFDRICERFGVPRVVAAIKQRAGKHTRPLLLESNSLELSGSVVSSNRSTGRQ